MSHSLKNFFSNQYSCLLIFLGYIPLLFLGFGSDSDTYTALNAWDHFLETQIYQPSRLPGYVIHEFVIHYAVKIGDSLLANFISLAFACLSCVILIKIARHSHLPNAFVLLLILNPVFIVNATSTVDYIWAMFFFLAGLYLMIQKRVLVSSLVLAFSAAIRLSYAFLIVVVFLVFVIQYWQKSERPADKLRILTLFFTGGILILLINLAAYVLPLTFAGWDLPLFLTASMGDKSMWSPLMRVGRWGYKNLLLWGVPSSMILMVFFFFVFKRRIKKVDPDHKLLLIQLALLSFVVELLFFAYPIEIEYLLPLLPFAALMAGILFRDKPKWIVALSVMILINGFFAISIARPDVPNHATTASLEFRPVQGYLLEDIHTRPQFEEKFHNTDNWWYVQRTQRSSD